MKTKTGRQKRKAAKAKRKSKKQPTAQISETLPRAERPVPATLSKEHDERQKHPHNQNAAKKQESPKKSRGGFNLNMLYGLFSQIAFSVLFTLFLALGLYYLKERPSLAYWMLTFAAFSIALAVNFWFQERLDVETELSGVLRPARDLAPVTRCQVPPNAMAVYFAGGAIFNTFRKQIVLQVNNDDLLWVEEGDDGVLVNAKVFSGDSRIVAQIINNEFHINQNNYFRRERPDRHTLIVYDQQGRMVLNVRFFNPSAVKVEGVFYYPNRPPIILGAEDMRIGTAMMTAPCGANTLVGFSME